jgi:hypothetical protein
MYIFLKSFNLSLGAQKPGEFLVVVNLNISLLRKLKKDIII